jgi:hypothetical protein
VDARHVGPIGGQPSQLRRRISRPRTPQRRSSSLSHPRCALVAARAGGDEISATASTVQPRRAALANANPARSLSKLAGPSIEPGGGAVVCWRCPPTTSPPHPSRPIGPNRAPLPERGHSCRAEHVPALHAGQVSLHPATYPPAFDRNDSLSIFERRAASGNNERHPALPTGAALHLNHRCRQPPFSCSTRERLTPRRALFQLCVITTRHHLPCTATRPHYHLTLP